MVNTKNSKFSSILAQKIPNEIARALIYAFLEWILICLLLIHSVFYLFVTKFANYFALKPPCLFCSTISFSCFYSDIICEEHASEISKLGYCSNHRKLVEFHSFCSDCSVFDGFLDCVSDVKTCSCCGKIDVLGGSGSKPDPGYVKLGIDDQENEKDRNFDVRFNGENEPLHRNGVLESSVSNPEPGYGKLGSDDQESEKDRNFDVGFGGVDEPLIKNDVLVGLGSKPEPEFVKLGSDDKESNKVRNFDVAFDGEDEPLIKNDVLVGSGSKPEPGYEKLGTDDQDSEKDRNFDVGFDGDEEPLIKNEVLVGLSLKPEPEYVKLGSDDRESDKDRNFDVGFNGENEVLGGLGSEPELGYEKLDSDDQESEKDGNFDEGFNGENEPLIRNEDYNDNEVSDGNKDYMLPQHLEFYIDHDDYRLIPVDLVKVEKRDVLSKDFELVLDGDELVPSVFDSKYKKNLPCIKEEEEEDEDEDEEEGIDKVDECMLSLSPSFKEVKGVENGENAENIGKLEHKDGDDDEKMDMEEKGLEGREEEIGVIESNEVDSCASLEYTEEDSVTHLKSAETDAEKSKDVEEMMQIQAEEPCTPRKHETHATIDNLVCEVSTCSIHFTSAVEHGGEQIEGDFQARDSNGTKPVITEPTPDVNVSSYLNNELEERIEDNLNVDVNLSRTNEVEDGTEVVINESNRNVDVNLFHTNNEVGEERIPDTPTSVESPHHLHKLSLLGSRESATEESLDGSMISEHEGGDGAPVVEKLKTELQAERKALRALYKELEEERNAAAIAANQTMAMITRIQEEKATMQMEALQYQRMMEEQSEYDQEALQMMNELMVKREKEKQELEKELDVYRRKVIDYEERERMRLLSRRREESMRSRNSSASCSYGEESDGLSIDLNHEAKDHEEDAPSIPHTHDENGQQDTPADAVLNLQDSLASFEEERQVILEQLKVLEEKLFTLAEEEEGHIENKPFEQFCEENDKDFEDDSYEVSFDANGGAENGFSHVNGKHHEERRINGSMQKRLLPLFDATELLESSDLNGKDGYDCMELHKSPVTRYELEKKRLAIEEEVDNVYERLQALEADREFLKHCIGSLRKGDKGLDLLQEILQHLRDLKSVELQVMKNMDHCASV